MAERVVVVLEAVEVEEDQRVRTAGRGGALEVVDERAAVGELGQLVGERLVAGGPQEPEVLGEHQDRAGDPGEQRAGGEHHGERAPCR